jgi:hypothetical protein
MFYVRLAKRKLETCIFSDEKPKCSYCVFWLREDVIQRKVETPSTHAGILPTQGRMAIPSRSIERSKETLNLELEM